MINKENNKSTLKWIYARIRKYFPLILIISAVAALVSLFTVSIALATKEVFDVATGVKEGSLKVSAVLLFSVIAVQIILSAAQSFMNTYTNGKLTLLIRNHLFASICKKKFHSLSSYHSGDLLNRLTSDTDVVVQSSVSIIPNIVSMVTKILAGTLAMLIMNPKIALIIIILGVLIPAVGRIINKKYKILHKQCQETEGETRSFLQECFQNIVVIKTFISDTPFIKRLNRYMEANFRFKIKRTGISIIIHIALYSFFTIGYYAVLVWGAGGLAAGTITYGTLMAFLQLIAQLRAPLQNVSGIMPQYYSALASAERLIELEKLEDENAPLFKDRIEEIKNSFKELKFNNLSFAYKNEDVIENCNLTAKRGDITAITGESGSGKSTLFKLVLGLYEPQIGNITVNDNIIVDTSTRGLFAYVPQGNMVISGSIRDNITLCNPETSDEKIKQATLAADIYDFICTLPMGLETELSERGLGLSEGQIQRISIARALLTDAPILLLDEATSALDEETETRVLTNIKNMTDKTVIFITHRNQSLKVCDRIFHIENKNFLAIK